MEIKTFKELEEEEEEKHPSFLKRYRNKKCKKGIHQKSVYIIKNGYMRKECPNCKRETY